MILSVLPHCTIQKTRLTDELRLFKIPNPLPEKKKRKYNKKGKKGEEGKKGEWITIIKEQLAFAFSSKSVSQSGCISFHAPTE